MKEQADMPAKGPVKSKPSQTGLLPKVLILAGVVVLVIAVYLVKNQPSMADVPADESLQVQFDRYLQERKPILAFFHSTNCHSCIVMMNTVAQVYPEFKTEVGLVDVKVYDLQNEDFVRRERISSIPTLVFIDRNGQRKISIGVLEPDQLRQRLQALKETP